MKLNLLIAMCILVFLVKPALAQPSTQGLVPPSIVDIVDSTVFSSQATETGEPRCILAPDLGWVIVCYERPFNKLEVIDPNPVFLDLGGSIVQDPERLARGGFEVDGVAADGVTQLLLRSQVPGPGQVTFCLPNLVENAPLDGGIAELATIGPGGLCATTSAVETSNGFMAYARYTAPENYNKGFDALTSARNITILSTWRPDFGTEVVAAASLRVVRPPVVMVHGLWSSSATWRSFPLVTDNRFQVSLVDYQSSNASSFSENQRVVYTGGNGEGIQQALSRLRARGFAVTQVDVVGHSMGGILTRLYAQSTDYRRPTNYSQGDINRLITLNAPHFGTRVADALVELEAV